MNRQRASGICAILWGLVWAWVPVAGAQDVYVEVVERSTPGGIFTQTSTTRLTSESHTTRTAPTGAVGYAWAHWTVNGERTGTEYGRALNPATFVVTQAMDAVAIYYPTNHDSTGFGVPDWWQYRHFGTLTNAADSDADGDGIGLAREYVLGLNPQVSNTLDGGGISLRVGDLQLAVVNSNLFVYRERSVPGGFFVAREVMATNGQVMTSTSAPTGSAGYALTYWTVNGDRQANATGVGINPITLVMTQDVEVIAQYSTTNRYTTGSDVPDWWLERYTGSITNALDSDADGDGIPLAGEYRDRLNPGMANTLDGGGISVRVGDLQLAVVNSNLLVYREQSAPGGFFAARELMLSNGQVQVTTSAPTGTAGHAFTQWTLNGERQANAAGVGINPVTFAMTQNVEAVAHYTPTNRVTSETGIPDWWLERYTGGLTNAVEGDADGDGLTLIREWELRWCPGVPNTLDGGGVSVRAGAMWQGFLLDSQLDADGDGLSLDRELELGLSPNIANTLDGGGVSARVGNMVLVDVQVLLGVFLEPEDAIAAGALWRVDGGEWYNSGEYRLMAAGERLLELRDAEGWEAPPPQSIPIFDHVLSLTGTYVQVGMGELTAAIEPEEARLAGAQWRLDGPTWQSTNNAGLEWRTNGAVVSLTARQQRPYEVIGKDLPGWHTPQSQEAWVTNGQRAEVTLTYSAAGYLAVTATPPAAAALGGWRVEEGDWQVFGESATLLVGDYEVEFQPVAGWHTPANRSVTISQGATASLAVDYVFDDAAGCNPLPLDWKRMALASGEEAGPYTAIHAVDDDLATRWRSPVDNDQWLQIDLGRVSTLAGLTIQWDAAYAKVFTVGLSLDGETWTEVAAQTNGVGGLETLYWPPQTARHVRLDLAERFYGQWGFGIWEIDFVSPCGVEAAAASEATWTPENPADDELVEIRYVPNDGPLAAAHAAAVFVRYSVNGGAPTSGTDVAMAVDTNGVWTGSILPEPGDSRIDFVFHNGAGFWDATGGSAWGFALRPGAANVVRPDPGILEDYRDLVGEAYRFNVTGSTTGTIWGTGIYKDDSPLAVAAVHAGALTDGEQGTLLVTIEGPQETFEGTERHGVVSLSYGAWTGSYSVARSMEPELLLRGTNGAAIDEGESASTAAGTDFGRVAAGTTSTQALQVVNTGLSDLEVTGAEITGTDSNAFQVLGLPLTVAAGQTSLIHLVYSPQATAGEDAEVTLVNNTVRSNFSFGVRGTVPRELTMTGLQVNDKIYDGYISGTVASYGLAQVVEPGDEVIVNTARVEALFENANAGEDKRVTVTGWALEGADAYQYSLGDQIATATVHRAAQTLTFAAVPNQDWTNRTVTLQASASSGHAVSFGISGPATVIGNTLTFTSTGMVSVTAYQAHPNWQYVEETRAFEIFGTGALTWDPMVPANGQTMIFRYTPELGPLSVARTVYLGIEHHPEGLAIEPGPAMKYDGSNTWSAVFLVPENISNLVVHLFDEVGRTDDRRGALWHVTIDPSPSGGDPAPSSMGGHRDHVGETFVFEVTGDMFAGALWGTDIYTDDSPLAMACVHAGVLAHAESGLIAVSVLGPQDSFVGSTQNGVTSSSYGSFGGSYSVQRTSSGVAGGVIHLSTNRVNWTVDASVPELAPFVVENTGTEALDFEVQGTADWMNVVPVSGQLEVAGVCTVNVSWVEQFLPIGEYLCSLEVVSSNAINPPQYLNVLLDVMVSNAAAEVTLDGLEQVYDGAVCEVTATTDPAGLGVEITYNESLSPPTDAGSYAVVATVTDPGWIGSASGTLVVARAPQTILFAPVEDQAITNTVVLEAVASSGLEVVFDVVEGPAVLSGNNQLTFTGTGMVAVVASQGGDGNWETAPDVTNRFEVLPDVFMECLPNGGGRMDDFEGRVAGELDPWRAYAFAETESPVILTGEVSSAMTYGGSGAAHVRVELVQPGAWSGVGIWQDYDEPWALPDESSWSNIVFSAALCETNGRGGSLTLQLVDDQGLELNYSVFCGGGAWSEISVPLSRFAEPDWGPGFDESRVASIIVRMDTGSDPGICDVWIDNVSLACMESLGHASATPFMYFRGTPNGWGTTPMELVADHRWEIQVAFEEGGQFKFDTYGDWAENYGDTDGDGFGEFLGENISVATGTGIYRVWFDDSTLAYGYEKITPAMGALRVDIVPPQAVSAGAQWRIPGGSWQDSGSEIPAAEWNYGIGFKAVAGWIAPTVNAGVVSGELAEVQAEYVQSDPTMYFRGTANEWALAPMQAIASGQWEIEVQFEETLDMPMRFQFDKYGDWLQSYGEDDSDGVADLAGADIPIAGGEGLYRIRFNEATLRYSVEKTAGEGLPYWVAVADCFEDRDEQPAPWAFRTYSANVLPVLTSQDIAITDAYAGVQAARAEVDNPDPGGWSGIVMERDYPQTWVLPSQAHWSNIVFSAAIRESSGQAGNVTLSLYDDDAREFQWTTSYDGSGWQVITASLDQFIAPDWGIGFNPSRVAGLSIAYAMPAAGTYELEIDHVTFGNSLYVPSVLFWEPETPRANEPITLTYQPNQGVLAEATAVVARVGYNGWASSAEPNPSMTFAEQGNWRVEITPPVGAHEINAVLGDDASILGTTSLWDTCFTTNWNIPLGLATQTIEFAAVSNQVVTGQVVLAAAASSGLEVQFRVVSGPAQLSGSLLTFTGPGTVVVEASQSGDADWDAAPIVTNQFEVLEDVPASVNYDVVSAYGEPSPATGRYEYAYGEIITNTMPEGTIVSGSTRHSVNGAETLGAEVLGTTMTSVVVRLTNNASLTWQWLTDHWLAVGAAPHGVVDVESGWQVAGAIVNLTAHPSPYYDFDRWLGVDAVQHRDNPLHLEMDGPRSVQAVFRARLTSTGTPEWWLADQGWTDDFEFAASDDPDEDGFPTWAEQLAGTDPRDPASFFRFDYMEYSTTHIGVYWPSLTGREYGLEYSTNLVSGGWAVFPNGRHIAADPPENRLDISVTNLLERHRMFRVRVGLATNEVRHEVAYVAGPNGTIGGTGYQELGAGEPGQMVWAIPDEGYEFVRWSDGSTENPRTDVDVESAQVLTAEFAPIPAPPPDGQAIENVTVSAPVIRSYADPATIEIEAYRNCQGMVEIWRTDVSPTPAGILHYSQGEVVRRLETPLMAGRTRVYWDGRDDAGQVCSNGLYQFRILATNASGDSYTSYHPAQPTNSVAVESPGIQPVSPRFRANEACQMNYSLESPAAMVVYVEQDGATWDSWVQFRAAGPHADEWSGRHTQDGRLLDGPFTLEVLARELPENALVLDRQLLTDVEAEIYAIRPVYDQVTTLNYSLSSDADIWIELRSPGGHTSLLAVEGLKAPGRHSYVWDGRVTDTSIFSEEGDYTLNIVASSEDSAIEQRVSLNVMGY